LFRGLSGSGRGLIVVSSEAQKSAHIFPPVANRTTQTGGTMPRPKQQNKESQPEFIRLNPGMSLQRWTSFLRELMDQHGRERILEIAPTEGGVKLQLLPEGAPHASA